MNAKFYILAMSLAGYLSLEACSDSDPAHGGERLADVIGTEEEGSDSSGSVYFIPRDKIEIIKELAKNGDDDALKIIVRYYYFSYQGNDREEITEIWQKIAADREFKGITYDYFKLILKQRRDCDILKIYANKAKRANVESVKEIEKELRIICITVTGAISPNYTDNRLLQKTFAHGGCAAVSHHVER